MSSKISSRQRRAALQRVSKPLVDFLLVRSLVARFWWAFFVLSIGGALLYVLVVAQVWVDFVDSRTQHVHWHLAQTLAQELEDTLTPKLDPEKVRTRLAQFQSYTPMLETYLYIPSQELIVSSTETRKASLDEGPIRRFLNSSKYAAQPIRLETAPLYNATRSWVRVFSASAVITAEGRGYVIVVLGGKRLQEAVHALSERSLGTLGYSLIVGILITTSVLGMLVFFVLSRRFKRMTEVVQSFERGDLSQRITTAAKDELGTFARAFNTMADRIEDSVRQLEAKDSLRRELVADVSHELRRPLTALRLALESLETERQVPESTRAQGLLQIAIEESDCLDKLIADLFALSKLEAAENSLTLETIYVEDLIEESIAALTLRAEAKSIQLITQVESPQLQLFADCHLLERALGNLVENAIKYAPASSTVVLRAAREGSVLLLSVTDSGPGISEEHLEKVFGRFFRAPNTTVPGAGLGLAIAHRILTLHQGSIEVSSVTGEGSTFTMRLPLLNR